MTIEPLNLILALSAISPAVVWIIYAIMTMNRENKKQAAIRNRFDKWIPTEK